MADTADLPDARLRALDAAHEEAVRFLTSLADRPVWPRATYEEMLVALGGDLPAAGGDPATVVRDLARAADPGVAASSGGRFFGFVIGGALPAALAADWLVSVWDQSATLNAFTPAAAAMDAVSGQWVRSLLGLPEGTAVGLVTGAMMANFTCLAAARHSVLDRVGWDVNEQGLVGAPPVRVVVGGDRHDTVDRAVRYLGLGQSAVRRVDTDAQGRIEPAALSRELALEHGPVVVCLQAGEVHTGAFDPFEPAIAVAREHGAWVHVDGAFGLWAAASPRTRHLTRGVAAADSWATDAHKTLNVPYDCGLALVRDPRALTAGFGLAADYLVGSMGDPLGRAPELSRRARGVPLYAALRSLGSDGVAALVDQLCDRAAALAEAFAAIPGAEVVNEVGFTQVMVAFENDDRTAMVGQRLLAGGEAALTPATWRGRAVLRCAVSNWSTTASDVVRTARALELAAAGPGDAARSGGTVARPNAEPGMMR